MIALIVALMGSETPAASPPPSAPADPVSFSFGTYGTPTKYRFIWENGDASAYTYIKIQAGGILKIALPGETSWDSDREVGLFPGTTTYEIYHVKGGLSSGSLTLDITE